MAASKLDSRGSHARQNAAAIDLAIALRLLSPAVTEPVGGSPILLRLTCKGGHSWPASILCPRVLPVPSVNPSRHRRATADSNLGPVHGTCKTDSHRTAACSSVRRSRGGRPSPRWSRSSVSVTAASTEKSSSCSSNRCATRVRANGTRSGLQPDESVLAAHASPSADNVPTPSLTPLRPIARTTRMPIAAAMR
jgi:hypothetical protein